MRLQDSDKKAGDAIGQCFYHIVSRLIYPKSSQGHSLLQHSFSSRAHIMQLAMVDVESGVYYFIKYCFILVIVCFKVALNNCLIDFDL